MASEVRPEAVPSQLAEVWYRRSLELLDHGAFQGWNAPYGGKRSSATPKGNSLRVVLRDGTAQSRILHQKVSQKSPLFAARPRR